MEDACPYICISRRVQPHTTQTCLNFVVTLASIHRQVEVWEAVPSLPGVKPVQADQAVFKLVEKVRVG